ncbi:MAG: site-specific DNA-methyltransferase, partial [Fimbriimonadales bacterium]
TLLPRFRGRVQTIYIDPPYNTGNDDFPYHDRFRHSSWLTMMENRLSLAREWLSDSGVMFVSLDDNEMPFLRQILDATWGIDSYLETFIWNNTATPPSLSKISRRNAEYILSYTKKCLGLSLRGRKSQGHDAPLRNAGNRRIEIVLPPKTVSFYIPDGTYLHGKKGEVELLDDVVVEGGMNLTPVRLLIESKWTQEKIDAELRQGTCFLVKSKNFSIRYKKSGSENDWITPDKYIDPVFLNKKAGVGTNEDATSEMQNLGIEFNGYPKPVSLIHFLVRSVVNDDADAYVLDFFAGSGTTAHAVINLNRSDGGRRKYILVEMADYIETIVLPRIKKAVFSDKWKDGSPQKGQGVSHFLKYYTLESFEDALRHTRYADDPDLFTTWEEKITYLFLRDPKMAHALEVDLENNTVRVDLTRLYPDIDLAETLSCLKGKGIKRIYPNPDNPTKPGMVEFTDGTQADLENPDWRDIKCLIWW